MRLYEIAESSETTEKIISDFVESLQCKENRIIIEGKITEANISSILSNTAEKVKSIIDKTPNPIKAVDELQGKVWSKMQAKGIDKEDQNKIAQFAKKHAKLIKPALMIAIVSASLLGMDTANAGDFVDHLDQIPTDHLHDLSSAIDQDTLQTAANASSGHADASNINSFVNDFYSHMKDAYGKNGTNAITINGQTIPFEDAVKMASKESGIDPKQFIKWMATQKDLSPNDAQNEFYRWLMQIKGKGSA